MNGLASYGDEESSSDIERQSAQTAGTSNDNSLKALDGSPDALKTKKMAQIKIKRPAVTSRMVKVQTRAHVSADLDDAPLPATPVASTSATAEPVPVIEGETEEQVPAEPDDLGALRALLRPPEIPGLPDWGIPGPSQNPCDPVIATKLAKFHDLKRSSTDPKHFNDSLMSNRSFRNPHLYAKLVEFVEIGDESVGCSEFHAGPAVWSGLFGQRQEDWDWDAESIAEKQKTRAEKQSLSQAAGKTQPRKQIDFTKGKEKDRDRERATEKERALLGAGRHNPYGSENQAKRARWA
ncbi:hypothetical protein C8J56DRAFT_1026316 [Mycena floridula]|nr:hypothetical protein C8J56DRAFT_1026316 [Mycena floridula]